MTLLKKTYKDKTGREYKHLILPEDKKAIVCLGGENKLFNGTLKFVERTGNSVFGDEVIIEFLIKKLESTYNTNSPHEICEMYLKKEEAIELFEELLKELKEQTQE